MAKWADHFTAKAKKSGYRARSVFKLEALDEKFKLLRAGQRVLDLGCAPGAWSQYAAKVIGPKGHILAVDLKPVSLPLSNVECRQADVFDLQAEPFEEQFDVVLSDMAPSTTGDHKTDTLRSEALVEKAIWPSDGLLRAKGSIVLKLLEGGGVHDIVKLLKERFTKVQRYRPPATRKGSTEIFLVGLGKKEGESGPKS